MKKVFVIIIMLILVSGCSATNKKEPPKKTNENNISEKEVSLINNQGVAQTEDEVVNYIESSEKSVDDIINNSSDNDATVKEKLKNTFITLTDFIFYGGKIKGKTFKELSDTAQEKVISLYQKIDEKINNKFPDYKTTINETTTKTYSNVVQKAKTLRDSIIEKYRSNVGEEAYQNTENAYVEDKNNLKNAYTATKDNILEKTEPARDYVKKKASSAKDKVSSWYKEFKEKN